MSQLRKIINDPVFGFITVDHPLTLSIIAHPYYQRLRRIHQMAFASLVYPGAVHTRLHHSLGAYHLMCLALTELRNKGVQITKEEEIAAKIAILLHDVGHGPYSHALEKRLVEGVHHEQISRMILYHLNTAFSGALEMAIAIFNNQYPKQFLYQLVSGQLDVDRMDYLSRDSFFTGVSEGVIGYDRLLKMLVVHQGQLMVEEKAIYSVEKFLVARRLMYWQVYLHKTVVVAERMLVNLIQRAKELIANGHLLLAASPALNFFLKDYHSSTEFQPYLEKFCELDDSDVMCTLKSWCHHDDTVLSLLSRGLVNRALLKIRFSGEPIALSEVEKCTVYAMEKLGISREEASYLVFTGEAVNTTYNSSDESIQILFKDGSVSDISTVDNALIQHQISTAVKKYYICYLR